jgi:hypothetical protein
MAAIAEDILERKPRTITVLGLLVVTSFTFSYLSTYALSKVLVKADILRPISTESDPRPRWLAITFCVLLGTFGLVGAAARQLSRRHLKRIDLMEGTEDNTPVGVRGLRDSLAP